MSQHKLLKTVRNFGSLCVKYSRETDTVKEIENYVHQATTEDFQYVNCHEAEDLTVVDGKDAKGLPVDVSTVGILYIIFFNHKFYVPNFRASFSGRH